MSEVPVLVVGDPHGDWRHVRAACRRSASPGVLILLGDLDLADPLAVVLAAEIAAERQVRWIIGNHDSDNVDNYDNLVASLPDGDIGSRSFEVEGIRIGDPAAAMTG
jgi:predicted phosphodiesterase